MITAEALVNIINSTPNVVDKWTLAIGVLTLLAVGIYTLFSIKTALAGIKTAKAAILQNEISIAPFLEIQFFRIGREGWWQNTPHLLNFGNGLAHNITIKSLNQKIFPDTNLKIHTLNTLLPYDNNIENRKLLTDQEKFDRSYFKNLKSPFVIQVEFKDMFGVGYIQKFTFNKDEITVHEIKKQL